MPSIIPRSDWGAAPARGRTLVSPDRRTAFVVHYDGTAPRSATAGPAAIRATQTFHQKERGWADVGYNFLVTQDGRIFEGRGWDVLGAHAGPGGNVEGIGVQVHIGGTQQPSDAALASVRWLYDVACKRFGRRLAMRRHRDYMSTSCPGAALSEWVAQGMPAPDTDAQPATPAPAPAPQPEEDDMPPIYFEEIRDFEHGGHGWQVITDPPALKVDRPIQVSARAVIHGPEGHRLVTRWAMGHDEHEDFWITDEEVIHTSHHAETTLTRWISRPDVHLALDVYSTEPGPHRLVITGHYWEV